MKRYLWLPIIALIAFVLFISTWIFVFDQFDTALKEDQSNYEQYVGTKVVIDGDSLTITDYSTIFETYTLSNGTTVTKAFVEKK